ncbi:MAG: flavodoxin family protein [Clostridiales bacterium]|nr:flavodoxin family protein [Clostridiales bacterium]
MNKKCLIINGSPKLNGNTYFLINEFKKHYAHSVEIVNVFPIANDKGISSCIDCGGCSINQYCCLNDGFKKIIADDYEQIIIASPIYQSNLPGPMFNLINRFNFTYNNKVKLNIINNFKNKQSGLILVGGGGACKVLQGENNQDLPIKQAQYIFKKLNATLNSSDIILCLNTDEIMVQTNLPVLEAIKNLALRFNN